MKIKEHLDALNKRLQECMKPPVERQKLLDLRDEYSELLNYAPDEAAIIFPVGTINMQLGFNGVAINLFRRVIELAPDYAEPRNNMGAAYRNENNTEMAEKYFREAIEVREDADFYNNLATLYINEGKPEKGLEYCRRALELNPEHYQAHWNNALLELEVEDYNHGFVEYESGLLTGDRPNRVFSRDPNEIPYWGGQKDKTVVVYGEQGLGDEILFSSCFPDMIKDCKDVIIECHPRMVDLYKRSFPGITVYGTRKDTDITWPTYHDIDYRIAVGSLMKLYRRNGNFPRVPYLKPDEDLTKEYREMLESLGDGPYIGIGWMGGAKKTRHDLRSFKISNLKPIFEKGGTFVSMQYTEGAKEKCERFYEDTGIKVHHFEDIVRGFNYDKTVALANALDISIVPNTTLVHVCGAIGKPCITLTPVGKAWRYQDGDEMAFYGPWVKQYHKNSETWDDAINRVAGDYPWKL